MRYVAQKEERTTAFSAFELEASAWTSMEVMAGTFGQRLIFFLVVSIARRLDQGSPFISQSEHALK